METELLNNPLKISQKINLIDGVFTPQEASDVLMALIDEKINYHKIKILSITEGDLNNECAYDVTRIDKLKEEKQLTKDFLRLAKATNEHLEINATIEIKLKNK
ncbi:hypothetical protein [Aquimarina agarilytica]|uniref:hypothetical protein n=1 Tax=Aquimarina agarilytica TaxID=1087449 RepID=UPI000289EF17|nr:hypothetical protein [Aquimarina agarilytica]